MNEEWTIANYSGMFRRTPSMSEDRRFDSLQGSKPACGLTHWTLARRSWFPSRHRRRIWLAGWDIRPTGPEK